MITQDDIDAFAEDQKPPVTRVEVIGKDGRVFVTRCKNAEISMQDQDRTIKVFLVE